VPMPNTNPTAREIKDFCKLHLASYKLPRKIEFRSELPKTAVGKVLRRVLIEEEQSRKGSSSARGEQQEDDNEEE